MSSLIQDIREENVFAKAFHIPSRDLEDKYDNHLADALDTTHEYIEQMELMLAPIDNYIDDSSNTLVRNINIDPKYQGILAPNTAYRAVGGIIEQDTDPLARALEKLIKRVNQVEDKIETLSKEIIKDKNTNITL